MLLSELVYLSLLKWRDKMGIIKILTQDKYSRYPLVILTLTISSLFVVHLFCFLFVVGDFFR